MYSNLIGTLGLMLDGGDLGSNLAMAGTDALKSLWHFVTSSQAFSDLLYTGLTGAIAYLALLVKRGSDYIDSHISHKNFNSTLDTVHKLVDNMIDAETTLAIKLLKQDHAEGRLLDKSTLDRIVSNISTDVLRVFPDDKKAIISSVMGDANITIPGIVSKVIQEKLGFRIALP
jgi:hypothetical protein